MNRTLIRTGLALMATGALMSCVGHAQADTRCTRTCLDDECSVASTRCSDGTRGNEYDLGDGYRTERWRTPEGGTTRCRAVCLSYENGVCTYETVRCTEG